MIETLISQGYDDIEKIYDKIENETQYPRPTIRSAKSQLLKKYKENIAILEQKLERSGAK